MSRIEEELPAGAIPTFDVDRGQEVVFVTADGKLGTWRAPYCGKKTFIAPKFRATREELKELERQVTARVPKGSTVRVLRCETADADGREEWTVHAPVEHSSPMLAGD
jgi:hypothetical protein